MPLLAVLAAGAVMGVWIWQLKKTAPAPVAQATPVQPKLTEISLSGPIRARNIVAVSSPIEGRVESFQAEIGDDVYEGQIIAIVRSNSLELSQESANESEQKARDRANRLDADLAQAKLDASRARAEASRARGETDLLQKAYDRQRMLLSAGATPRLVFEKSEAEYRKSAAEAETLDSVAKHAEERVSALQTETEGARAALNAAADDAEHARVTAEAGQVKSPVDGVVISRRGEAGEVAHPGESSLFEIATDITELEVLLEPQPDIRKRLQPGQQALVQVPEIPNEALPGLITSVDGPQVVVSFRSPTPLIKPGLTAQVRLKLT